MLCFMLVFCLVQTNCYSNLNFFDVTIITKFIFFNDEVICVMVGFTYKSKIRTKVEFFGLINIRTQSLFFMTRRIALKASVTYSSLFFFSSIPAHIVKRASIHHATRSHQDAILRIEPLALVALMKFSKGERFVNSFFFFCVATKFVFFSLQ